MSQIRASMKEVRKTGKNLRIVGKQTKSGSKQSFPVKKIVGQIKRQSKQVIKTSRAASKTAKFLTNVFRDQFGRFVKASKKETQPRTKKSTSKKSSQKNQPSFTSPSKAKNPAHPKRKSLAQQPKAEQNTKAGASKKLSKKISSRNPPSKKSTPAEPKKQAFSTRNLRGKRGETTLQLFERLQNMGDSPDTLLNKGERWMFTYGKGRAKRLYGSFQQAVDKMHGYLLTQGLIDGSIDPNEDDIERDTVASIKIMKTDIRPFDYVEKKEAEEKLRDAERKRIQRHARAELKSIGIEPANQFGGSIDLLQQVTLELQKERAKNATTRGTKPRATKKTVGAKGKAKAKPGVRKTGERKAGSKEATKRSIRKVGSNTATPVTSEKKRKKKTKGKGKK